MPSYLFRCTENHEHTIHIPLADDVSSRRVCDTIIGEYADGGNKVCQKVLRRVYTAPGVRFIGEGFASNAP